jgi:DtxR family transcriptional regulator, iron-dependent repressor
MTTPATEEYLEMIHTLAAEEQPVYGAWLAASLRVSRPTVSTMVQRLARDGLIEVTQKKNIRLTKKGSALAEGLSRRHRIVERWLTDTLGLDWAKSDAEAHHLEHTMSEEVIERLNAVLGRPLTCPHGNPIPGNARMTGSLQEHRLSQTHRGDHVRISRISEYAENIVGLLDQLGGHELKPDALVTVVDVVPRRNSLTLAVQEKHCALSPQIAEYVWVRKV